VLYRCRVLDQIVSLGCLFADDETAADGVELLGEDLGASDIEDREQHAVGVEREQLVRLEDDVTVGHELDRMLAIELEFIRVDDSVVQRPLLIRVDGLRVLALEPPDDRTVGVVTAAGGGERAVEIAADPSRTLEQFVFPQLHQKEVGRPHRAHRVRRRRPDADLEDVEDAELHRKSVADGLGSNRRPPECHVLTQPA